MQARTPAEVVNLLQSEGVEIVDFRFCDLPGLMQHFSVPAHQLTEDGFDEGYGFDGSSIRGFQEIQESDMLLFPDPDTAVIDPFRQHKTLNVNCFVKDPVTGESYTPGPPLHRPEGPGLPDVNGRRRHRLFRSRGRVLRVQRHPLRPEHPFGVLCHRLHRGRVELRQGREAQPRLQAPVQGGLLPRPAHGPLPGSALRDDPHHGVARCRDRSAAPRGRHRGPGGDRHALRHPAPHGRQAHALQVRGEERGAAPTA